jgi:hypothetical protein
MLERHPIEVCSNCGYCAANRTKWDGQDWRCLADPEKRHIKLMVVAGCAKGYFEGGKVNPDKAPAAQVPRPAAEVWGPPLWRELHTKTDADPAWLERFTSRVPCGECRGHWRAVLAEIPPVFGAGWREWTIRAHDAVNARLGKPMWNGG